MNNPIHQVFGVSGEQARRRGRRKMVTDLIIRSNVGTSIMVSDVGFLPQNVLNVIFDTPEKQVRRVWADVIIIMVNPGRCPQDLLVGWARYICLVALELLVVAINYIDTMCAKYWNNWISIRLNAPHHLPVHTSSSQEHTSRINRMTASGFCAA